MSTIVQADPRLHREPRPVVAERIVADGKFLRAGDARFLVKGVTYGTFAPDAQGYQFPSPQQVATDFGLMADLGINTVRTYTAGRPSHAARGVRWSACRGRSTSRFSTTAR